MYHVIFIVFCSSVKWKRPEEVRVVSSSKTHAWNIYQASKLSFMEFHVCISLIEHLSYASPHVCFSRTRTLSYIHRFYEY